MRNPRHPAYGRGRPPLDIHEGEVGHLQLVEFLRELFRIGFLGPDVRLGQVSFDVGPLAGQNPTEVINQTKAALDAAFAEVQPPQATASAEPTPEEDPS